MDPCSLGRYRHVPILYVPLVPLFGAGLILSHLSPVQYSEDVFYQGGFAFHRLFVLLRGLDERVVEKAQGLVHPSFELQVPDDIRQSFMIRVPRNQSCPQHQRIKRGARGHGDPGASLAAWLIHGGHHQLALDHNE